MPVSLRCSTRGGGQGLLEANKDTQLWSITHKGRAVYDSSLPLELAMQLYDDLKKAEEGMVMAVVSTQQCTGCHLPCSCASTTLRLCSIAPPTLYTGLCTPRTVMKWTTVL